MKRGKNTDRIDAIFIFLFNQVIPDLSVFVFGKVAVASVLDGIYISETRKQLQYWYL